MHAKASRLKHALWCACRVLFSRVCMRLWWSCGGRRVCYCPCSRNRFEDDAWPSRGRCSRGSIVAQRTEQIGNAASFCCCFCTHTCVVCLDRHQADSLGLSSSEAFCVAVTPRTNSTSQQVMPILRELGQVHADIGIPTAAHDRMSEVREVYNLC